MSDVNQTGLYDVQIRYNVQIPVRDGLALSANLFMPVPREEGEKFPAILEMIPYRKDDWRSRTDHKNMSYLARRGYVGCRLDVRGTGSSPGVALDEYTQAETQDGYDAVEWLAGQSWCNGKVGMWGISYGGFTAIQVAKMCPPALKAIVPMYATDDRYTDDVHYVGGCLTCSEFAQYAVSQVGMNAMPPSLKYAGKDWAELWKTRLENTPPWLIEWLRQQTDGPYWRNGSLAPDYERIRCAIFSIGGWADGYTNAALRMQEKCTNAPGKTLIGPWVHSTPDGAYPGPNVDWMAEMVRFFDYWLKDVDNGVMDDPALTVYRGEYTPPEPFPKKMNGDWCCRQTFPGQDTQTQTLYLGRQMLQKRPCDLDQADNYVHRPTLGTRASLCWGGGVPPNGLARDLRPDEALSLIYTGEPLDQALDILGFPEAVLYLSSTAGVSHVVVRLTDVAPDGTSALVSTGILNLTHRDGHSSPSPLVAGDVYEIRVALKAACYRFLPGHCLRLSVASAYWPVIWPSPYRTHNLLHRGPDYASRLILPLCADLREAPAPAQVDPSSPGPVLPGLVLDEEPVWQIIEDVIGQSVTVKAYGGDTSILTPTCRLFTSESLEMTAYHEDPARVFMSFEVKYDLQEAGYDINILCTGSIRSTETDFHLDIELQVTLNGKPFFQRSWLESIARTLL